MSKWRRSWSSFGLPLPPQPRSRSQVYSENGSRKVKGTGNNSPSSQSAMDALSIIVQQPVSKPQRSIGIYKYVRHYSDF